jgi:hypothetical protein
MCDYDMSTTQLWITIGGALHFAILIASVQVPKLIDWKGGLAPLTPFLRKLFWVYGAFVLLTMIGFGTISLFCASDLAGGTLLARMFMGLVALFWGCRLLVQFFVFDTSPFAHRPRVVFGYHLLGVIIAALTGIYATFAITG